MAQYPIFQLLEGQVISSEETEKLGENFNTLLDAIVKAKPASSKGQYIKSCVVASTMGPGIRINPSKVLNAGSAE